MSPVFFQNKCASNYSRKNRIIRIPVGYPAQPRLIHQSVCESLSHITFNYSAENHPGPTDLVKHSLKIAD